MANVILSVEAVVQLKSSDTVSCEDYDKLVKAGKLKTEQDIKKEVVEVLKHTLGAADVVVVSINTVVQDERRCKNGAT